GTNVADSGTTSAATSDPNYFPASGTATLTINKATATVVVNPYSVTYDAAAHTASVVSITGVNGEVDATVGSVDVSNTTHTNAGTYAADYWFFTGTANYNDIGNTTITDVIGQATANVNVVNYTGTYDGFSHTASVTITGVGNVLLASNSKTGTNVADSGTTSAATSDPNYFPASGTATLTIN